MTGIVKKAPDVQKECKDWIQKIQNYLTTKDVSSLETGASYWIADFDQTIPIQATTS